MIVERIAIFDEGAKLMIIDITQELFSSRLYPGDKQAVFERVKTIGDDEYNLTNISMSVHNGTHVDAPSHFVENGKAIHELDLSVFYGKCTIVSLDGIIEEADITNILETCQKRLLFKGKNELSESAAELIARSSVELVGVESQSVGNEDHPLPVHMILLKKGVIPLEGLDLSCVMPGEYVLSAFPLNMQGVEGSPVRAVLIKE